MSKLRRRKPHPKWGATKAQGKRNAEIRDLKNQIFELTARRDSTSLTIETSKEVVADLIGLVNTGYFGPTVEKAAEQLLRERMRELVRELATGKERP